MRSLANDPRRCKRGRGNGRSRRRRRGCWCPGEAATAWEWLLEAVAVGQTLAGRRSRGADELAGRLDQPPPPSVEVLAVFTVEHAAHELIHTAGPPGSDTVAFVRVGWDQDRDPTGRHPLHLLGVPVPGVSQHHLGSVSNPSAKKRLGAVAARERLELWLERRELTLVVGVARRRARPAPPSGMQFLDGDAALAASSRDGIGRPRVDRPGEWWQTVTSRSIPSTSILTAPRGG